MLQHRITFRRCWPSFSAFIEAFDYEIDDTLRSVAPTFIDTDCTQDIQRRTEALMKLCGQDVVVRNPIKWFVPLRVKDKIVDVHKSMNCLNITINIAIKITINNL